MEPRTLLVVGYGSMLSCAQDCLDGRGNGCISRGGKSLDGGDILLPLEQQIKISVVK